MLHLEAVDSSRVKGANCTIKCYIKQRNYDLRQTWKKIKIGVESQIRDLAVQDEQSRIRDLTSVIGMSLYHLVLRKVTRQGFVFIEKQRCLDDLALDCTRIFTKTMGLPCVHTLRCLNATNLSVQLADIHRH